MRYLTFLDYSTLTATGKNLEARLEEKEKEITYLRQRETSNSRDIAELRAALNQFMCSINTLDSSNKQRVVKNLIKNGAYRAP